MFYLQEKLYTGHKKIIGGFLIVNNFKPAPFFCACPV
jgi:hypothetical protein